jgi:hypothetical protein
MLQKTAKTRRKFACKFAGSTSEVNGNFSVMKPAERALNICVSVTKGSADCTLNFYGFSCPMPCAMSATEREKICSTHLGLFGTENRFSDQRCSFGCFFSSSN